MKKVVVYQHLVFTSACLDLMASALSPCHTKGFLSLPKPPRDCLHLSQHTRQVPADTLCGQGDAAQPARMCLVQGTMYCTERWAWGCDQVLLSFGRGLVWLLILLVFCCPEWLWILEGCCLLDSPSLCDGRWIWGFRARQGHPTIKVLCTWMLPWWTGFTFLTYLKPIFVFLAKGWVLQALSISSCNRY